MSSAWLRSPKSMPKLVEAWSFRTSTKFAHALFEVMFDEGLCRSDDYDGQIRGAEAAGLISGLALDVEDAVNGLYAFSDPSGERVAEREAEKARMTPTRSHCGKTEPCVDDVYCNCNCADCEKMPCFRPGCRCKRSHAPSSTPDHSPDWNRDLFALWVSVHIDGFAVEALRKRWLPERWVRDPP